MARAYSQDLRDRVIDAVAGEGLSRRAAARRFGVSAAAALKWLQRFQRTGERGSAGTGGHRPSKVQPHRVWVMAVLAAQPAITLAALAARLWTERGVQGDIGLRSRFFKGAGLSFKKKPGGLRAGSAGHCAAPPPVAARALGDMSLEALRQVLVKLTVEILGR